MKKILAIMLSLTAAVSLAMISVSAEALEVIEGELPPIDPSQTYEVIIVPEETTPVVTTTVQTAKPVVTTVATTKPAVTTAATTKPAVTTVATTKPATKPVSKPSLTQKEVKQVAEVSMLPTSIALNILNLIK